MIPDLVTLYLLFLFGWVVVLIALEIRRERAESRNERIKAEVRRRYGR